MSLQILEFDFLVLAVASVKVEGKFIIRQHLEGQFDRLEVPFGTQSDHRGAALLVDHGPAALAGPERDLAGLAFDVQHRIGADIDGKADEEKQGEHLFHF